ncbi:MAG: alpha/beta hydrolase family protein [Nocardioidaceae bacterium]
MPDRRIIDTPHGPGRLLQRRSVNPWATLVLTHGAGGGIDAPELDLLSRVLPPQGISVALVEQPWRLAGKRIAPSPRILDEGFCAVVNKIRPQTPMFVGGRSAGARVACRTARGLGGVGVVTLAFPLHPPGRPERSRVDELLGTSLRTLVVQGERDTFGTPAEFPLHLPLVTVPQADHSFSVPAGAGLSQVEAYHVVVEAVAAWIRRRLRR